MSTFATNLTNQWDWGMKTVSLPLNLDAVSNIEIKDLAISSCPWNAIYISHSDNILIDGCRFYNVVGVAIYLYHCTNVTIQNCTFDKVAGGVCVDTGTGIKVLHCNGKNISRPVGSDRGQLVQFARVTGASNEISYNSADNKLGFSGPEDIINLYDCHGTALSPILVTNNKLRGGGPSTSGGGIMTGDTDGSYITVDNNILVNPGQYGITIASGHDIIITNNTIFSKQTAVSNVGLSAYLQYVDSPHYNCTIANNQVKWTAFWGDRNEFYNNGGFGTIIGWDTNVVNEALDETILPTILFKDI